VGAVDLPRMLLAPADEVIDRRAVLARADEVIE
jgi:hypothetical protein